MHQNIFNIKEGSSESLDTILHHQQKGGSVLRSAHIGNFNSTTLFLAQKGIPIILHEFIKGNAPIYEPAFLKIDGKKIQISERPELPLTHDTTLIRESVSYILNLKTEEYTRPAQLHFKSLSMLPGSQVQLSSEFLLEFNRLHDFLRILAKTHPHQFGNYIFEDGTILNSESVPVNSQQRFFNSDQEILLNSEKMADAAYENLYSTIQVIHNRAKKNPQGIIFRSNLYILLSTLVDFYRLNGDPSKEWKAIHFSGAQMMNYMIRNTKLAIENQKEINEMFQILKREFPKDLPMSISFLLVPTEGLGAIVSTGTERKLLQEKLLQKDILLQELFKKRRILQETISKEVRHLVAEMSDEEIKKEVKNIFLDIKSLPPGLRKLADQTHSLLDNVQKIQEIRKGLESLTSARKQAMQKCDKLHELEGEIEVLKNQISYIYNSSSMTPDIEVSQYDILFGSKNTFTPQGINGMSMRDIQEHINYTKKFSN